MISCCKHRPTPSTPSKLRNTPFTMPQPIHVWYGDGDHNPLGPIEAELLETLPNGDARFRITDPDWLRHVGWDEPVEFTYGRLLGSRYVHYDAYAWCPVGEGGEGDPWWRQP